MANTINKQLYHNALSAVDICKSCLVKIEQLKVLNAFISVFTESSLREARESDKRLQLGNAKSNLDGIPIAVKDNFCTYNEKTTCASKMLENFTSPYDATVVKKLKNAGAVIIGKTNLDEFAMGSGTVDSIYGQTKNIWGVSQNAINNSADVSIKNTPWRIAGGSSGGSAVAVATGMCFAALGSDTGGSTRNPASYCGVVGFKPSYGTVSRYGLIPLVNSMDVPGIIARKVDHVADVYNVISDPDHLDSTTIIEKIGPVNLQEDFNMKNISVGIPKEYKCEGMSVEIQDTWRHIADIISNSGAAVKEVSMPYTEASLVTYSILNACEVSSNMARYSGLFFGYNSQSKISTNQLIASSRSAAFGEVVKSRILLGNYFLLQRNYEKYFVKAMKIRQLIANDFENVWSSGVNFLLTPTTLTTAPLLSEFIKLDNRQQCATQDYCTQPANMTGCPAISLPICLSKNGLPISLQIMANNFQDKSLLAFAKWIESAVSFPHPIH